MRNIPKLRFPEFKLDTEWEDKSIKNIAKFLKGNSLSKADISLIGNTPCILFGELYTHYNEIIDTVISYTDLPLNNLILSEANDVIIPSSGYTKEGIAKASCVLKSGIALGGDLNIIRTKINGIFLSYYLNTVKRKEIAQLAQGCPVVHLYSNQLQKLTVSIPSFPEQEKISACLISLDDKIKHQEEKINKLKELKKGLLQQLFPNGEIK